MRRFEHHFKLAPTCLREFAGTNLLHETDRFVENQQLQCVRWLASMRGLQLDNCLGIVERSLFVVVLHKIKLGELTGLLGAERLATDE